MSYAIKLPDVVRVQLPTGVGKGKDRTSIDFQGLQDFIDLDPREMNVEIHRLVYQRGLEDKILTSLAPMISKVAREQPEEITGPWIHERVQGIVKQLVDGVWVQRAGPSGRRADPRMPWLRQEADLAARKLIAEGGVKSGGRVVTSLSAGTVKSVRDVLLANEKWCAEALAKYEEKKAPGVSIELDLGAEPQAEAA